MRAVQSKRDYRWWLLYATLVALGMYTLYYLALLWLAHAAWLVWRMVRNHQGKTWYKQPWVRSYAVAVMLFLPWLPTFFKQTGNGALAPIGQPMNLENLLGVFSFNLLYKPVWQLTMVDTFIVISATAAGIYLARSAYRSFGAGHREHLWLLVAYIGMPIAVLMLVSFARSMYVERYLSHIAIALPIMLGIVIGAQLRQKHAQATKIATVILITSLVYGVTNVAAAGNFNYQRMSKPDVAAISRFADGCNDNAAVVAADPYVAIELAAHLPASCPLYFYSDSQHLGGGYAPLNGSRMQLTDMRVSLSNSRIFYVYYDQPKLTINNLKQATTISSDNLHVSLYR